ncbi:Lacal_2735 family protein [Reichenbachiella versicolor]|uniref:Lacal_2735 family protein n=1 Tax=Reichenbachiella versicolor TaxID=1821036 RepID=UPI000D6E3EB1|nr:Lacal_2735 family protein [Reichenbachiella versicolor]
MFGLFKSKSPIEKLEQKYEKLIKESHRLSTINRAESDAKYSEAQAIMDEIEKLKQ